MGYGLRESSFFSIVSCRKTFDGYAEFHHQQSFFSDSLSPAVQSKIEMKNRFFDSMSIQEGCCRQIIEVVIIAIETRNRVFRQ